MRAESQIRAESTEALRRAPISIAETVAAKASMDEDSFRVFYDRTVRPLWAYLLRVSGDRDAADDLLQESYCRFLSVDLPPMNEAESKSYLFRIASNLLRDRWRRKASGATLGTQDECCDENLEARADVRRAFQQLNPRERQLLWLAYVEGWKHKEIADVTGLRAGSVRLLLFRARRKLGDVLRRQRRDVEEEVDL